MHLKELNHRSPIRILERSVHGGLGPGNLGIVAARAGVGKSGFLTSLALDDLLRGRKVLHVTVDRPVAHVRDFYDEVFADLARHANLEETVLARRRVDENRFIHSFVEQGFDVDRVIDTVSILRESAGFDPDVLIVDGFDFGVEDRPVLQRLKELAARLEAELWMALKTTRQDVSADWHELPGPVARLADEVSVVIYLQPAEGAVHVRLLKDHDREDVVDPGLDLDPRTFLLREA